MAIRTETAGQMDQVEQPGAVTMNRRRKNHVKPPCATCGESHDQRRTCLRAWLTQLSKEETT